MKKTLLLALVAGCVGCHDVVAASAPPPLPVTIAGGATTVSINDPGTGVNAIKNSAGLVYSVTQSFGAISGYLEVWCQPAVVGDAGVVLGTTPPDWSVKIIGSGGTTQLPALPAFLPGMCGGLVDGGVGTGISYACTTTLGGNSQVACPASFTFK